MLWYIVDGWNVVNKVDEIKKSPFSRQALIRFIKNNRLTGSKNNKVTLVFDGFFDGEEIRAEKEFQLIFSGDKSADEVIIERVRRYKNKKQIVVVSDDREIKTLVKSLGANVLKVAEFLKRKEKKLLQENKPIGYELQREITEELRRVWLGED